MQKRCSLAHFHCGRLQLTIYWRHLIEPFALLGEVVCQLIRPIQGHHIGIIAGAGTRWCWPSSSFPSWSYNTCIIPANLRFRSPHDLPLSPRGWPTSGRGDLLWKHHALGYSRPTAGSRSQFSIKLVTHFSSLPTGAFSSSKLATSQVIHRFQLCYFIWQFRVRGSCVINVSVHNT